MGYKKLKEKTEKSNSMHRERKLSVGFPPNEKSVTVDEAVEMLMDTLKRCRLGTRKSSLSKLT